jgi:hypothetical protein
MTADGQWGLIMRGDAIVGVHSQSIERPLRGTLSLDEKATTYADWRFELLHVAVVAKP